MITTYLKDDLFNTKLKYVAHGCNCLGAMGSGVAKLVRAKYPSAFEQYGVMCRRHDRDNSHRDLLGKIMVLTQSDGKVIVNMFTQEKFGQGVRHVSYDAIFDCFREIDINIKIDKLAIPRIGAGLGGGDWKIISTIIDRATPDTEIYVYDPEITKEHTFGKFIIMAEPKPQYVIDENFNGA